MAPSKELLSYPYTSATAAVTLEGTIIHKGGNITGGRSTHNNKKWEDQEVAGMRRTQDVLIGQLKELSQSKPRNNNDDAIVQEIGRLESALVIARDELVRVLGTTLGTCITKVHWFSYRVPSS